MKKNTRKILKKAHRMLKRKIQARIIPFTIAVSMLLGVVSLTSLGYSLYKDKAETKTQGDVAHKSYKEPHTSMSAQEIFKLGTESFHTYLYDKKNEEAFDNAEDYFGEAHTRNKVINPLDSFIAQEYLVILSAMHRARKGHSDKYREDAADRLRVARDGLIGKKQEIEATTTLSSKQKYASLKTLDSAIGLLLQTILHLSTEESVYTKKRVYLSLAKETAQMLS